jgi:hypothetical protein
VLALNKMLVLLVIAALIVPPLVFQSAPNVRAQANIADVRILSYSNYTAPSTTTLANSTGDFILVGEIQNVGSSYLTNVNLTGIAFDSEINTIAIGQGNAFVFHTAPGQKAPFYLDFPPQNNAGLTWISNMSTVQVTISNVTESPTPQYSGLHFISNNYIAAANSSDGIAQVNGIIGNNGTQKTGSIWVVTTFYDKDGNVVALNFTYNLPGIGPNGNDTFSATPTDNTPTLSNKIVSYSSQINSLPSSPITQSGISPTPATQPFLTQTVLILLISIILVIVLGLAVLGIWLQRSKTSHRKELVAAVQ